MAATLTGQELPDLLRTAAVPVWMPWPLPAGWLVSGFAAPAGGGPGGAAAGAGACVSTPGCVVALSGPNPFGGPGEMLIISEEAGLGLGASFAGLPGLDPGSGFTACQPHAFVRYSNRQFPLWHVDAPHRAVYAGAVLGHWLWLVLFPDTAGLLLAEPLALRDLRDPGQELDLPYGERSALLPD
ncbi:MAG TPA: DUF6758 family protein [Streptosporangiaceae bacterium]|jgi:hypothetical protein